MGLDLNRPVEGNTAWFTDIDDNWATLEDEFVARLKSDTSPVTVTGTTAETALMANTTVPADSLDVGTVLDVWAAGYVTIAAMTTPTISWRLRWGGLAGTFIVGFNWNFGSQGSAYTLGWITNYRLAGVSTGASGSLEPTGWMGLGGSSLVASHTAAVTIDTTADKNLLWTAQSSLTSSTVVQRLMVTKRG